jgi:hypothetical protein
MLQSAAENARENPERDGAILDKELGPLLTGHADAISTYL